VNGGLGSGADMQPCSRHTDDAWRHRMTVAVLEGGGAGRGSWAWRVPGKSRTG
jgi:hypothetical protein